MLQTSLNEYFSLSFHKFYVYVSHYSFKAKTIDSTFPKSWYVEGSLDNNTWTVIDTKTNRDELITNGAEYTYQFDTSGIFKHLRFTHTQGTNEDNFCLRSVEVFGVIINSLETHQCNLQRLPKEFLFILWIT